MAKLVVDDQQTEIKKGQQLLDVTDEQGLIPYACRVGACTTCACTVKKGAKSFNPVTDDETALGGDETHRLACKMQYTGDEEIEMETGWI